MALLEKIDSQAEQSMGYYICFMELLCIMGLSDLVGKTRNNHKIYERFVAIRNARPRSEKNL